MSELKLHLRNTTPLLVGGYDPRRQDEMGLRATEIKGLWRWWCRAFVAGALYELGVLRGRPSKHVLIEPSRSEAEIVSCFVGRVLGLGYAGSKGAEPSRYRLYVEPLNPIKPKVLNEKYQKMYQRIRLLQVGRGGIEGLEKGYEFNLVVEKEREEYRDAEDLALKILIASLQLSGIGKGSRRGLGSLDIIGIEPHSILDGAKTIEDFIDKVYEASIKIVKKYGNVCTDSKRETESTEYIPPLPLVSKRTIPSGDEKEPKSCMMVYAISRRGYSQPFELVHEFFLRSSRCKTPTAACSDELRENLLAWFLGLPREGRSRILLKKEASEMGRGRFKKIVEEKKIRTGYIEKFKDIVRRPSPIIVAHHENENIFGSYTFVTVFLSGDWPNTLEWVGVKICDADSKTDGSEIGSKSSNKNSKKRKCECGEHQHKYTFEMDSKKVIVCSETITIDHQKIIKAYETFRSEFTKYLCREQLIFEEVWPRRINLCQTEGLKG